MSLELRVRKDRRPFLPCDGAGRLCARQRGWVKPQPQWVGKSSPPPRGGQFLL